MWWECVLLGIADILHEVSIYGWDVSSVIFRHHLCRCASSICKYSSTVCNGYVAVRSNIQESKYRIVCTWKSRAPPSSPPLMSRPVVAIIDGLQCSYTPQVQLQPLLSACSLSTCSLCCSTSAIPSTVTPSSPGQFTTHWINVKTTSSPASRMWIILDPCILLSEVQPPMDCAGSFPWHTCRCAQSFVISWARFAIAEPNVECYTRRLYDSWTDSTVNFINLQLTWCVHWGCHRFERISSLNEWHTDYTQFEVSDNQITIHFHLGIQHINSTSKYHRTCWIRWFDDSTQTVHSLVPPWNLRIVATRKKHLNWIFNTIFLYAIIWAHNHICSLVYVYWKWS